jgi:hypothetical protein
MIVRDRLQYRHVPRIIVNYKGGGHSSPPSVQRQNRLWENELSRTIFSPLEYHAFTLMWGTWNILKPLLYDHFLYWIWRPIQHYRSRRNHARIRGIETC